MVVVMGVVLKTSQSTAGTTCISWLEHKAQWFEFMHSFLADNADNRPELATKEYKLTDTVNKVVLYMGNPCT